MKSKQKCCKKSREVELLCTKLLLAVRGHSTNVRRDYPGILSAAPEMNSKYRHRSPKAPRVGEGQSSHTPHLWCRSPPPRRARTWDSRHHQRNLSGGNSRSQAAHLVQHTPTVHKAQAIPRTPCPPTSRLGRTKIASVRSRMRTQVRADVHRDGRSAGGSAKAAGAHAPAAPPPQAARPETRSA